MRRKRRRKKKKKKKKKKDRKEEREQDTCYGCEQFYCGLVTHEERHSTRSVVCTVSDNEEGQSACSPSGSTRCPGEEVT